MLSAAPLDAALDDAVRAERSRNGRRGAVVGFVGISAFLVNALVFGVLLGSPVWRGQLVLLGPLWVISGLALAASLRSAALAERGLLVVPLVYMPIICVQLARVADNVGPRADGPATFATALYAWLVFIAGLSLDRRQVAAVALVAIALQGWLQHRIAAPLEVHLVCGLVIVLAAATSAWSIARTRALVRQAVEEHARRDRLGRYFSPQVAALLADRRDDVGAGEMREITVLFSDLRGFTTLSERRTAAEVVATLSELHTRMVAVVFEHGGTLDKYLGDGMMAYFGAPLAQPDHAARAVRCALGLQTALGALNATRAGRGEAALRMGIGMHSGPAILGDIGGPQRRE
jgi:adenylate cyclase